MPKLLNECNVTIMLCIKKMNIFSISLNMCSTMYLPLVMATADCLQHIHCVGTLNALAAFHQQVVSVEFYIHDGL